MVAWGGLDEGEGSKLRVTGDAQVTGMGFNVRISGDAQLAKCAEECGRGLTSDLRVEISENEVIEAPHQRQRAWHEHYTNLQCWNAKEFLREHRRKPFRFGGLRSKALNREDGRGCGCGGRGWVRGPVLRGVGFGDQDFGGAGVDSDVMPGDLGGAGLGFGEVELAEGSAESGEVLSLEVRGLAVDGKSKICDPSCDGIGSREIKDDCVEQEGDRGCGGEGEEAFALSWALFEQDGGPDADDDGRQEEPEQAHDPMKSAS